MFRKFDPSDLIRRGLWLLMLAGHVPAVIRRLAEVLASAPDASPGTLVFLAFACVLFVLKIVDVRWLRFKMDRRALVASTVLVALLHADVLTQYEITAAAPHHLAIIGGLGAAVVTAAATVLRRLRFEVDHSATALSRTILNDRIDLADILRPPSGHVRPIPPRGPPHLC